MSVLKVADFYYGAFLSALLNYGKKKSSLFDRAANKDSRRIYCLTTENSTEDYIILRKLLWPKIIRRKSLSIGSSILIKTKSKH